MNKIAVIIFSIFLITLVVVASLGATLYLSWANAEKIELEKLFNISNYALDRARMSLDQTYQILNALENTQTTPCSDEHVDLLRKLILNARYIDDIEYIENNKVKCSASGIGKGISLPNASYELSSGIKLIFDKPLSESINYIGLRHQNYNIIIAADRFTDVITNPYIKIAITTADGKLISSLNSPNINLIRSELLHPRQKITKEDLVVTKRVPDLYVIVSEAKEYVFKKWRQELMFFAPFGIIMAAIVIGIIIYFSRKRLSLVGELATAIKRKEFLVYYQPIISFKSSNCVGAEALVRWQRGKRMIRPDLFIPFAEETGQIKAITDQIIETVIQDMKDYFIKDREFHIAINIAPDDFNSGRAIQKIEACLEGTGIERRQIWLEITERGFMNTQSSRSKILLASQLGYIIVIDDFGTGYSSLSYLKELPINVLKIDKSFINAVATETVTSNVTHHIIELAKSLQLEIVAEGIEGKAQAYYLIKRQVEYAQGWLYAKAMPLKEFIDYYHKTNIHPEQGEANG